MIEPKVLTFWQEFQEFQHWIPLLHFVLQTVLTSTYKLVLSSFDINDIVENNQLNIKQNIHYLGNGVDLVRMTEACEEHFDFLQDNHANAETEELKVTTVRQQSS